MSRMSRYEHTALSLALFGLSACTPRSGAAEAEAGEAAPERIAAVELPVAEPSHAKAATGPLVPPGPAAILPGQDIVRDEHGYPTPKLAPKRVEPVEIDAGFEGPGTLRIAKGEQLLAIPLQHTDVETLVTGTIAETTVTQLFVNPYDEVIEAVYSFPLPHDAAVDDYWFHVGKRHIHGVMKEKQEAREIYETAKREGKSAALLEQQRPNVFTQSVANIPPGETILIELHMAHPLAQVDGRYSYAFPTVVGPRFLAGGPEQIAADAGLNPRTLPEGTRSAHDISIEVEIDAGLPISGLSSKSHALAVDMRAQDNYAKVALAGEDTIPNQDFELSWELAQDQAKAWLMVQRQTGGGYFSLTVQPPKAYAADKARGRELIFVVDNSGSMRGEPIATAKDAMVKVLDAVRPSDSFQVLRFSEDASALGPKLLPATASNKQKAMDYVRAMEGMGGTRMIAGVKAALSFPHDDDKLRLVLFMTDGYVSNDQEIFGTLQELIGDARLFSMGVGNSVNRHLLEGMALTGRGAVTYVRTDEDPQAAVDRLFDRVANPVLTDIEIDWGELPVREVVPARIPDLFSGQPVVVYGKFDGEPRGQAKLSAMLGDEPVELLVDVNFTRAQGRSVGLQSLWARERIDDLQLPTYAWPAPDERREGVEQQVIELALKYSVMTEYTSFVAVDQQRVVNPDGTYRTVEVPVPLPAGVDPQGIGEAYGSGGLGLLGTGRGGGGTGEGTIGLGNTGLIGKGGGGGSGSGYGRGSGAGFGGRGKRVPRVQQAKATVTGGLDKDVIRRIVRAHINQIRSCYNAGLAKDPKLAGTVEIEFVIDGTGKVSEATVKQHLADKAVGECVAKAIERWAFPQPTGGGSVRVKYPFVLEPG